MKSRIVNVLENNGEVRVYKKVYAGTCQGKPAYERGVLLATYGKGYPNPEFSGDLLRIFGQNYTLNEVQVLCAAEGIFDSLGIAP